MNKIIIYLLIIVNLLFLYNCSLNNYSKDRLLTGDKYLTDDNFVEYITSKEKKIADEFFIYNLGYFTFMTPGDGLPKGETEYLFIPKSKNNRGYFELYRYSDYSEVLRLADVVDIEYETINKMLLNLNKDSLINCDRGIETNLDYGFNFYFNIQNISKEISTSMLLDTFITERKKYLCFQSYLNSILFIRELDYHGNRKFRE